MPIQRFRDGVDGYTGTRDVRIASNSIGNEDTNDLSVELVNAGIGQYTNNSLLYFTEIKNTIIKYSIVLFSFINANVFFNPDARPLSVRRLLETRDWVETEATWLIYKTGSNWASAGGHTNSDSVEIEEQNGFTGTGNKRIVADSTAIQLYYQAVVNGVYSEDRGLLLHLNPPGSSPVVQGWNCRDSENGTVTNRPRLNIGYVPAALARYAQTI